MTHRFLPTGLAFLMFVAVFFAMACPVPVRAASFEHGLLWRIDRPSADGNTSAAPPNYLFGTLHIDDPRATAFSPTVRDALGDARVFMPELLPDAESAEAFALAAQLPGRPGLPGQKTLADVIGGRTAARVIALLVEGYHMTEGDAARLQPWAAYLALSEPLPSAPGDVRGEIVDAALLRRARERGLPVRPLETVAQQIASLEAVPPAAQRALLDDLARHHREAMAAVDQLTARYLAQDLAGLRRIEEAPGRDRPALRAAMTDLMHHLLDHRNDRMFEALRPQFEQGGTFAAVGALHLEGERGLLARFERAGWRVRPLD